MSARRHLLTLLCRAVWAPCAVLLLHAIVAKTPWRERLDFTIHGSGGAAIAYFIFEAIACLPSFFGRPNALVHYLLAFTSACTVGVFWEFSERFADVHLHRHIQQSLEETMSDLAADAVGAALVLTLIGIMRRFVFRPSA